MAVCRTCGQENPEIARFCLACGAPLAAHPRRARRRARRSPSSSPTSSARRPWASASTRSRFAAVIGRYFDEMSSVVERHGGTVEKFIGDAVMAVFGIPVVHEDDALRAVRAAVEMRDALTPLNEELEREHGVRIQVRVGVNTGEVVAGDPVGEQRFATGDAVNVAARLEQAARTGRDPRRESTHRLVRDAVTVESDRAARPQGQRPGRCGGHVSSPSRASRAADSDPRSSGATTSSRSWRARSTGSCPSGRAGW